MAEQRTQLDHNGQPLPHLKVFGANGQPDASDPTLPNAPFRIDAAPMGKRFDEIVPSPIHAFWHNQKQINGGRNNLFYNAGVDSPNFQPHHQPFNYHARFAPGTADRATHLRDGEALWRDAAVGALPAVTFYKPVGRNNQHPSYTGLKSGDAHLASVLEQLRASPQWPDMLVGADQ